MQWGLVLAGLAGFLGTVRLTAAAITNASAPFSLGPGETAFGVSLGRLNPAGFPRPLTQVQIALEATLSAGMEFFGDGSVSNQVVYRLDGGVLSASLRTGTAVAPPELPLELTGSVGVAAGASVSIMAQAFGTQSASVTAPASLANYQGTGALLYDVDLSSLNPQLLSIDQSGVKSITCGRRVSGRLLLIGFFDAPPIARDDSIGTVVGRAVSLSPATLLANDSDSDPSRLVINAVAPRSAQGGSVGLVDGRIVYRAASGFSGPDSFLYFIRNSLGLMAQARVTFVVGNDDVAAPELAVLGGRVWLDSNGDGWLRTGESGLNGVPVWLYLASQIPGVDHPVATDLTRGAGLDSGTYRFGGLLPGNYRVYLPTSPATALTSSTITEARDNRQAGDDNGLQAIQGGAVNSPVIVLSTREVETTVDFGFVPNGVAPPVSGTPVRLWQIGVDDNPLVLPYRPTAEFSQENNRNDARPGSAIGAADDDFYIAGSYPAGFNGLTAPLGVATSEPALAWERALTNGDRTNRVHFPLTVSQVAAGSRLRLNVEFSSGGAAYNGVVQSGFAVHDMMIQFRNGQGIATPIYLKRLSQGTNLMVDFAASDVAATAGANTIEIVRTGPAVPLTSYWLLFDYLKLEAVPVSNVASLAGRVWEDANNDGVANVGEKGMAGVSVWLYSSLQTPGVDAPLATTVTGSSGADTGGYAFRSLAPGTYTVAVPTPPASALMSSSGADLDDDGEAGDSNGRQTYFGQPAISPLIGLGAGEIEGTVDFGFVPNPKDPSAADSLVTLWQIGVDDNPLSVPYAPDAEFSPVNDRNDARPGSPSGPADDDFYTAGIYPAGFNGLLALLTVSTSEPSASWERSLTGGDRTNRVHFTLAPSQVATGARLRLIVEFPGGGSSLNGVTQPGFGAHDVVIQFRNGTGATTQLYSNRLTQATNVVVLIDPLSVQAGVGPNSIEIFRTGPTAALASHWIYFDYLKLEGPVGSNLASLGGQVWEDANNDGMRNSGETSINGVVVRLYPAGRTPGVDVPQATVVTGSVGAERGIYRFGDLAPGSYQVSLPSPPSTALTSSTLTDLSDNREDNDDNGIQANPGQPVNSPIIALSAGEVETTVDFGFVPNGLAPPVSGPPVTLWQIGVDDNPLVLPYRPSAEFSQENNRNDARPGSATGAADDDFYIAGSYPSGFNGLTAPLSVATSEPALAWERALTLGDRTNRVHFPLTAPQVAVGARLRLNVEFSAGGSMSNGVVQAGFALHDVVIQFRNGQGVATQVYSNRLSQTTNLVLEFAASSVAAGAGANTIEIIRTGPSAALTSYWLLFDYLKLEAVPVLNMASLAGRVWEDANNDSVLNVGEMGMAGVAVWLYSALQTPGVDSPLATTVTGSSGADPGGYAFRGLSPGSYTVAVPTPPAAALMSSSGTDWNDNGENGDDNGLQAGPGQAVISPTIALSEGEVETTVDFGFVPNGLAPPVSGPPVTLWQIGVNDNPLVLPYRPSAEFSQENNRNDARPGSATGAADDDFYIAGSYPSGFNGLTAPLSVATSEPALAWERALTLGDRTNRVHFPLAASQVAVGARLRLNVEFSTGGSMSNGVVQAGFALHDVVIQFRNGQGVATQVYSNRLSQTTNLVVEFAASSVAAGAGANTIEIIRTGPSVALTSYWLLFDYLRLEAVPGGTASPQGTLARAVYGESGRWDSLVAPEVVRASAEVVTVDGQEFLTITCVHSASRSPGDGYAVECSADLQHWIPLSIVPLSDSMIAGVRVVRFRDPSPVIGDAPRFVRLQMGASRTP